MTERSCIRCFALPFRLHFGGCLVHYYSISRIHNGHYHSSKRPDRMADPDKINWKTSNSRHCILGETQLVEDLGYSIANDWGHLYQDAKVNSSPTELHGLLVFDLGSIE